MKAKPQEGGKGTFSDWEFNSVYSDIPWHDYVDRMNFDGRIKKGDPTVNRSMTLTKMELRVAEIIKENSEVKNFQTVSDVLRDALTKGLKIDYEILIRRKGKIKKRADATFNELVLIDEELAVISCMELVQTRITETLQKCKLGYAGRDEAWGMSQIEHLIDTAESDYPKRGIREHFDRILHAPVSTDAILFNIKEAKKKQNQQW
jgi:hypothetical protein